MLLVLSFFSIWAFCSEQERCVGLEEGKSFIPCSPWGVLGSFTELHGAVAQQPALVLAQESSQGMCCLG